MGPREGEQAEFRFGQDAAGGEAFEFGAQAFGVVEGGLLGGPRTGGMVSSSGGGWVTSLRFPPVSETTSAMPAPSVSR